MRRVGAKVAAAYSGGEEASFLVGEKATKKPRSAHLRTVRSSRGELLLASEWSNETPVRELETAVLRLCEEDPDRALRWTLWCDGKALENREEPLGERVDFLHGPRPMLKQITRTSISLPAGDSSDNSFIGANGTVRMAQWADRRDESFAWKAFRNPADLRNELVRVEHLISLPIRKDVVVPILEPVAVCEEPDSLGILYKPWAKFGSLASILDRHD